MRQGLFSHVAALFYTCRIHPLEPAGAILSTATDMVKWIKFNLDLGRTESGIQLLDRKLMEEMHWVVSTFDNQNTMKTRFLTKPKYPVDEIQIGYVYAWFLSSYRGKQYFSRQRFEIWFFFFFFFFKKIGFDMSSKKQFAWSGKVYFLGKKNKQEKWYLSSVK